MKEGPKIKQRSHKEKDYKIKGVTNNHSIIDEGLGEPRIP